MINFHVARISVGVDPYWNDLFIVALAEGSTFTSLSNWGKKQRISNLESLAQENVNFIQPEDAESWST